MAVLTISRQMGSLGDPIAAEVARRLEAPVLDRTALLAEPARYGLPLERRVPPELDERGPSLLERLGGERPRYTRALRSALYEFALQHDPAVIVGFGGQVFFAPLPQALRVLIVAPFEARVENAMRALGVDHGSAAATVRRHDRERAAYHQYVHHVGWLDPALYHLVVNTGATRSETVVAMLVHLAGLPDYQPTPQARQVLADLALAAGVEARLVASREVAVAELGVRADRGRVTVTGVVPSDEDRWTVEDAVRASPGVRDVDNQLVVRPRPQVIADD